MKTWGVWLGSVIAVLGLVWALLPHTLHATIVHALTGISVDTVLAGSHTAHRIEGWSAFVIGLLVAWLGMKK